MPVPHPIPYQGSKRRLADVILGCVPANTRTLVEPFSGSAAVSLAAAFHRRAKRFLLNDLNSPLMALWERILSAPDELASQYGKLWRTQLGQERAYYDLIRREFNETHAPHLLLYLLARCVKASVRYNADGQFNQSPDNRRKGMHPATMRRHILCASELLRGKSKLLSIHYANVMAFVEPRDVVYMDPPYQGVCRNRDPRYMSSVSFEEFANVLASLNERGISYIVSYDGRTGTRKHGRLLPAHLGLTHIEVDAGRSTQETLLGRDARTYESLYLSPALVECLEHERPATPARRAQQAILF